MQSAIKRNSIRHFNTSAFLNVHSVIHADRRLLSHEIDGCHHGTRQHTHAVNEILSGECCILTSDRLRSNNWPLAHKTSGWPFKRMYVCCRDKNHVPCHRSNAIQSSKCLRQERHLDTQEARPVSVIIGHALGYQIIKEDIELLNCLTLLIICSSDWVVSSESFKITLSFLVNSFHRSSASCVCCFSNAFVSM